ncbi:MAG: DNA repair protein RadA [Candidatus Gastranaerophilales bacterium]|nr:DNA repair protein RadA [Candidatus Gastranaerophilales bacterium]
MSKVKTKWVCQVCGYESPAYLGKCHECNSWSSFVEEKVSIAKVKTATISSSVQENKIQKIHEISIDENTRFSTGLSEFDRVLGGGLVEGSLVLIAGDPGIGKSTLILQSSASLAKNIPVLYISAEESAKQIKLRAQRLNINTDNLDVLIQTNINEIKKAIETANPKVVIIDSIQAVYSDEISSSPASVSQVRECCCTLIEIAKTTGTTIIIVGHVTKDGTIAGPKVLEHMVDTVIYFEGERYKFYRILRSIKNRFGSTNEVGIFNMEDHGLVEVKNPSELFLSHRQDNTISGSVVIATNEGSRTLLVEVQALAGPTSYPSPRRVATGLEYNRMLQILAVLERRLGLNLSKHDIYVSVVGGIEINEPAADLGVAMAIASCARNVCIDPETVIIGELSLSGEIRPVNQIEPRIKEAAKLGFKKAIIPKYTNELKTEKNISVIQVSKITEAITASLSKANALSK